MMGAIRAACAEYLPINTCVRRLHGVEVDMSSSASFTGDGGAQRVLASQAIWAGSVAAGRCVVTLLLCPALITAAAFLTLYTLLWWRWSRIRA